MDSETLEVSINIDLRNYIGGNNLQLRESVSITKCDFMQMAKILGAFHIVLETLKENRSLSINGQEIRV